MAFYMQLTFVLYEVYYYSKKVATIKVVAFKQVYNVLSNVILLSDAFLFYKKLNFTYINN